MKKILMLLQAPFPPDIRLEKEIKSLSVAGYKVRVICNQYDKFNNPEFRFCETKRIKALFNSIKLNRIINFPVIFNFYFTIQLLKNAIQFRPDFIHAHDLPMMPFAILLKSILRVPLIFDMHENYPEALRYFNKKGLLNFIFKNPKFALVLEKISFKNSDHIIVVVQEGKDRLVEQGIDEKKIIVVSNTAEINRTTQIDQRLTSNKNEIEKLLDFKILLYTGKVSIERGLETAVRAMKFLNKKFFNIILVIVGDGEYVKTLDKMILEEQLTDCVHLIKWPGQENVKKYFDTASICIIPQPANDFINTTIPHKLFEYMMQKKPVLTSDAIPLKRIVTETKCGLNFKSNDPVNFAYKVEEILSSNIPFGENGLKAVKQTYNWEKDSQVLIKLYQDFESK